MTAYEIASKTAELIPYIPEYFGEIKIDKVLDSQSRDISNNYLMTCCYSIAFIHGSAAKLNHTFKHIQTIINLFSNNNIKFLLDATAFNQEDASQIKLIDFAVSNAYSETEAKWIRQGLID